ALTPTSLFAGSPPRGPALSPPWAGGGRGGVPRMQRRDQLGVLLRAVLLMPVLPLPLPPPVVAARHGPWRAFELFVPRSAPSGGSPVPQLPPLPDGDAGRMVLAAGRRVWGGRAHQPRRRSGPGRLRPGRRSGGPRPG